MKGSFVCNIQLVILYVTYITLGHCIESVVIMNNGNIR
jgi:hypothetical protein